MGFSRKTLFYSRNRSQNPEQVTMGSSDPLGMIMIRSLPLAVATRSAQTKRRAEARLINSATATADLWLRQSRPHRGHREVTSARHHLNGFRDLRIILRQHLDRCYCAVRRGREIEANLLFNERPVLIERRREHFPILILRDVVFESVEDRVVHREIFGGQVMSEFDSAIDFVGAQAGYVAVSSVARK